MADEAPTFEDQTADFVVETAEPETPAKEDKPNAETPKPGENAPEGEAPATEETDDDTGEADADKSGGETGEPDAGGDSEQPVSGDEHGDGGDGLPAKRKLTAAQRHEQIQTKLNESTRQLRETERRVAEALAKLEAANSGTLTPKERDTTKEEGGAPPDPNDAEKYPYGALDEQYLEDRTNYAVEKALKAKELKDEKARQADAATALQSEMQQKRAALEEVGAKKYEDFHEVVVQGAEAGTYPITRVLGELILTSPEGADVAYHLASNPKVAREIAGKSPMEQAAWFGRIAAKFPSKSSDAPAKPAVKTPQAPPPVKPARGAGVNPGFDPNNGSFEEFERHFRAAK
jgi:hypothetical protein